MSGSEDGMEKSHDFHHPYTPYAIQETFMETVYQLLEEGKVGILESPTGTVSDRSLLLARDQMMWFLGDNFQLLYFNRYVVPYVYSSHLSLLI
jgi:hypothetical protein